jgi:hypothetical protein
MSRLQLFDPDHQLRIFPADVDGPQILPFSVSDSTQHSAPVEIRTLNVVSRALTLFENSECPTCQRSSVEPLELRDAQLNRNDRPIPGTATLVGFHCLHCDTEWPA